MFTCVQAGRTAEAAGTLGGMVTPVSVGAALTRACDVALALAGAGHALKGAETADKPASARLH